MKYAVIMPTADEAGFIIGAIETLQQQTLLPEYLIVADDGSADETIEIVREIAVDHPWVSVEVQTSSVGKSAGESVAGIFNKIWRRVSGETSTVDLVVKMDADVRLEPHYFAALILHFRTHPRLGIAGGLLLDEQMGVQRSSLLADADHVHGACKAYRWSCLKDLMGLREVTGWDTLDELLATKAGWQVLTDKGLTIRHLRPMGSRQRPQRLFASIGRGMYQMRYGLLITMVSAAKLGLTRKPWLLAALYTLWGWLKALWLCPSRVVTEEEGAHIRSYRYSRMAGKAKRLFRQLGLGTGDA